MRGMKSGYGEDGIDGMIIGTIRVHFKDKRVEFGM